VEDTPIVNGIVLTLINEYNYLFADEDPEDTFVMVESIYEYTGKNEKGHLTFGVGEEIKVTNQRQDGWWFGEDKNGKQGLFPTSYVKIIPPNLSKKRKFLKELKDTKKKIDGMKKNIENLEHQKLKLEEDLKILIQSTTPDNNKKLILDVQQHNPRLKFFTSKLEGFFTRFEIQTKYRANLDIKKKELLNQLQDFKKDLNLPKNKKFKDKIELIDNLRESFEQEQKTRSSTDANKDRIVKDLTEFKLTLK